MNKIFVSLVLCFFLTETAPAEETVLWFSWNLGYVDVYYNSATGLPDITFSLGQINLLAHKKAGLSINLFSMGNAFNTGTITYAFLPLKAEYRVVNFGDIFYISLYGKAAWQFTQSQREFNPFSPANRNGFSGGTGLELLLSLPVGLHYEGCAALFFEYGFPYGFQAGIRLDLLSLGLLTFLASVP
jgi:hypothetical protein